MWNDDNKLETQMFIENENTFLIDNNLDTDEKVFKYLKENTDKDYETNLLDLEEQKWVLSNWTLYKIRYNKKEINLNDNI